MGVAVHLLDTVSQASAVHGSASLQFESAVQHEGIAACAPWWVVGLHVSVVQTFVSMHSPSVVQQAAIGVWPHVPFAVLHTSVVHASESSQSVLAVQQLACFV
jgi:hypothetical protein